jgi:hypothetical protein
MAKRAFNLLHCAGIYKRGPKKGRVKATDGYASRGPNRCPAKMRVTSQRRVKRTAGCRTLIEKAYKSGILKGRKLQAEHKPTPPSVPATQAMLRGAGLGRAGRRRRR